MERERERENKQFLVLLQIYREHTFGDRCFKYLVYPHVYTVNGVREKHKLQLPK